jgi:uncharacterized protein YbjT (DUF2867 family)
VAHAGPGKEREFTETDLRSGLEAVRVVKDSGIPHLVYVSVAHPAPMTQAYIDVRSQCERAVGKAGLNATIFRPWYVLGPGHRWPYALIPFYKIAEVFPGTRESARRLGLVTLSQMTNAMALGVETPSCGIRVIEVPDIRKNASIMLTKPGRRED